MRSSLALALALAACSPSDSASPDGAAPDAAPCPTAVDRVPAAPIHTPRWAFEPWISKDISTTDDSYDFVGGFQQRDIPVGVLVLDSPWETNYHTFVPNPVRYHDFGKLVSDMHAKGVRLVLWMTQLLNTSSLDLEKGGDKYDGPSPNFGLAAACHFFVDDGQTYIWWKGAGAGIDFNNPAAVAWWHRQQDLVLPLIDGWKLDFGEQYISQDPLDTATGPQSKQAYSEAYYKDFYDYGVQQRGADFTTMVRGWDESYHFDGRFYARKEQAPVVWAGDNRHDTVGFADALYTMFKSAAAGYVVVGSDLGGYLQLDDKTYAPVPADWDVFSRWTAVSAIGPFMELHGQANLTPWTVPDHPDDVVTYYRYWAHLHHELVPFYYSLAEEAYAAGANGQSILRPVGAEASWAGDFRFHVGDAFLVAPLLDGDGKPAVRDVPLPAGASYWDWWDWAAAPVAGGTTLKAYDKAAARGRVPLFVREGAIVPMHVDSDVTGFGTAASKDSLTVLVYPGAAKSTFVLHDDDAKTTTITAQTGRVDLSRAPRSIVAIVRAEAKPSSATAAGTALSEAASSAAVVTQGGYAWDAATHHLWARIPATMAAVTLDYK